MSLHHSPRIVTDGLVLALDAADRNSYPGSGTTWYDLSGNGNDGTLTNGPTFSGENKGSIVFDKVDDYIEVANQIQFERTNSYTLSAWINTNDADNNQIINNENNSYRGYQFSIITGGPLIFFLRNTVSTNYIGTITQTTVPSNTWIYLTGTYDGSSDANGVNIYFNGNLQPKTILGNNLNSTTISNETTLIGIRRPSTQGPFNGRISIIQIYNRALTGQEVLQNYNATKTRFGL